MKQNEHRQACYVVLCYFDTEYNILQVEVDDGTTSRESALNCTQKIGKIVIFLLCYVTLKSNTTSCRFKLMMAPHRGCRTAYDANTEDRQAWCVMFIMLL
jgi:hypothetical protein